MKEEGGNSSDRDEFKHRRERVVTVSEGIILDILCRSKLNGRFFFAGSFFHVFD